MRKKPLLLEEASAQEKKSVYGYEYTIKQGAKSNIAATALEGLSGKTSICALKLSEHKSGI